MELVGTRCGVSRHVGLDLDQGERQPWSLYSSQLQQARDESMTIPTAVACGTPHVLDILAEEHALQRELCDLLEAIADGLPHRFDRARATVAVSLLEGSLPTHTRLEDEALFPLLLARLPADDPVAATLDLLETDHDRELAVLAEASETLRRAIRDPASLNGEALGYLLRGFFDRLRHHIDLEDRVVLPTARRVLTGADHVALQGWIMRSGHPRCCRQSLVTLRRARAGDVVCDTCPDAVPAMIVNQRGAAP
jgi:hemerythrin-like domain-containing protein